MSLFFKTNIAIALFLAKLLLFMALFSTASFANNKENKITKSDIDVVKLKAEKYSFLLGQEISCIRLAVISNNKVEVIPFQIDKIDDLGMPHFPESDNTIDSPLTTVAKNDELLFMAADAVKKVSSEEEAAVLTGHTLLGRISSGVNNEFVVYVLQSNLPLSSKHYVQHNIETGVTDTDNYTLKVDPKNELNWQFLSHKKFGDNESVIDTMKMQMRGGAFTRFAKLTLNNNNLKPKIVNYKLGPIRSILLVETTVVIAKIPVMKMFIQTHRYPSHYEAHSFARIPALFRKALVEPEVIVGLDGNNLFGSKITTAADPSFTVTVDGRWGSDDKRLLENALSMDDNWLLFDTGRDLTMLVFFTVPEHMQHLPLKLAYIDDKNKKMKPENTPGQMPFLGYSMQGMPDVDLLKFSLSIRFYSSKEQINPSEIVAKTRN